MSLESYISSYLDGELSPEDDESLRALLVDDDAARFDFEQAALIKVAMMEDAESIAVPEELFSNTQQRVTALYPQISFANVLHLTHRSFASRYSAVSAILVALLITSTVSIRDGYLAIVSGNELQWRVEAKASSGGVQISDPRVVSDQRGNTPASINSNACQGELLLSSLGSDLSRSETNLEPVQEYFSIDQTSDDHSLLRLRKPTLASYLPASGELFVPPGLVGTISAGGIVKSNVQFSTVVGSVLSTTSASFSSQYYAQDFSYGVDESDNIGVEIGTLELSNQYHKNPAIHSDAALTSKHKSTLSGSNEPASGGAARSGSESGYNQNASSTADRNLFWGCAFYERQLYRTEGLNLRSAVGVGTSSDGPVIMLRSQSVVGVYGMLAFTLGAEGRLLLVNQNGSNGTQQVMQSLMSVVYGIQLKF